MKLSLITLILGIAFVLVDVSRAEVLFMNEPQQSSLRGVDKIVGRWKFEAGEEMLISIHGNDSCDIKFYDFDSVPLPVSGKYFDLGGMQIVAVRLDLLSGVPEVAKSQGVVLNYVIPIERLYILRVQNDDRTLEWQEVREMDNDTVAILASAKLESIVLFNGDRLISLRDLTVLDKSTLSKLFASFKYSTKIAKKI